MNIDFSGKTALVTASTAGIGFAIAKGLAESGARLILNGRSQGSVEQAKAKLLLAVPEAQITGIAADLSDGAGVEQLLQGLESVGPIDVLINNAGIYAVQDFFETEDDVWEEYWQTNVLSGVRLSRALLPQMVKQGWGRVVFISSESSRNIPADMIPYAVSKTAQLALSRGLAKRVAGTGVTVNAVLPGPTVSDGFAALMQDEMARTGKTLDEASRDFVLTHRPGSLLQRPATMEEVANLVVYVASPLASATTGAALRVDGGVVDDIL